ncbi:hypothetical protein P9112_000129 [Eukaryota sp. TZLM1-RC]
MKPLSYALKEYLWGPCGLKSLVARLAESSTTIYPSVHYSELWIGTHLNGPSHLVCSKNEEPLPLKSYLGRDLSFLFKILDVDLPLSIQIHPKRELAASLHLRYPSLYPDPNDKPEMIVTITDFTCMAGFRPFSEVQTLLSSLPWLSSLVLKDATSTSEAYISLLTLTPHQISYCVKETLTNGNTEPNTEPKDSSFTLAFSTFTSLYQQYPSDATIFSPFFLSIWTLPPRQSLFLPPESIHAYLHGTCIEVMTPSDNVIRAGLTPKFIDKEALSIVLCNNNPSDPVLSCGQQKSRGITLFEPPFDFSFCQVVLVDLLANQTENVTIKGNVTILLALSGSGKVNNQEVSVGNAFVSVEDSLEIVAGDCEFNLVLCCEK